MTKRERQAFRALKTAAQEYLDRAHYGLRIECRRAEIKLLDALVLADEVLPSDAPLPVVQNSATGERRSK